MSTDFVGRLPPDYDTIWKRNETDTCVPYPHYLGTLELAAYVHDVPGVVMECGAWRGGMIAGIADVLGPARTYLLADSFEGIPPPTPADGAGTREWVAKNGKMDNAPTQYAEAAMRRSAAEDYALIVGWFSATLPNLDCGIREQGIALLRLDADLYDSTVTALTYLWPKVNDGGLVIIDDYYFLDGAAAAVHDYIANNRLTARIETHGDWKLNAGVAFIRKGKNWTC